MKQGFKKLVALFCAAAMIVSGIGVIPKLQAKAEETPAGVTAVRWSDFGIVQNTVYVGGASDANNWGVHAQNLSAGKSVVNSSFRGIVKLHKVPGAGAMYFQYGVSSAGNLETKGIRFTVNDDGTITVFDMVNGGVDFALLNAANAGLSSGTFLDTEFELGIDTWQPTGSSDLKVNLYINGVHYMNTTYTITNGATAVDEGVILLSQGVGDTLEVIAEREWVPAGVTAVNWTDFGIAEDTTLEGGASDANNWGVHAQNLSAGKSVVNSSFRGIVKLHKVPEAGAMYFQYGVSNAGNLGAKGIRFTVNDDGTITVYNMANSGSEVVVMNATDAGLVSGSFLDTKFELGIDAWQPTGSSALKVNLYVNGKQYKNTTYTFGNAATAVDEGLILLSQGVGDSIKVITRVKEASPEGLTEITWADLGITENTTIDGSCQDPNWGCNDYAVAEKNVVNSSFRGKIQFHRAAGAMYFQYGGGYFTSTPLGKGVRFTVEENGTISIYFMPNILIASINATEAGLEGDTFIDNEFELGLDIWQVENSQDLKLNVYIDGVQYNDEAYVITNGVSGMENVVCLVTQGSGDFIKAIIPEDNSVETAPEGLDQIRWNDAGIVFDTTYAGSLAEPNYGCNDHAVSGKNLSNSSFRGTVEFHRSAGDMYVQYGGGYFTSSPLGNGIRFTVQPNGTMSIYNMPNSGSLVADLNATDAGISSGTFLDTAFELGIDVWQPEGSQDLKLIVYINGVQYNAQAYTIVNMAGKMDNVICLVTQGAGDYIKAVTGYMEASPEGLTQIGWKDFGITENKIYKSTADMTMISANTRSQVDVAFRGKVKFNRAADGDTVILAFGSNGWNGLWLTQTESKLTIQGIGGSVLAEITKEQANVTSFSGVELDLGLDIWTENNADIKINVFINGEQVTPRSLVWEGALTNNKLFNGVCVYATGNSAIEIIMSLEPSPEGLRKIGWADFGLTEDKLYASEDWGDTSGLIPSVSQLSTLVGTSFRGVISFNRADVNATDNLMLCYGDTGWNWVGIRVIPSVNSLKFQAIDGALGHPVLAEIQASAVGVSSFLNNEFELGIDLWEDNGSIMMNVFINGAQATISPKVWTDAVTKNATGVFNNLIVGSANDSIKIELPMQEGVNLALDPSGYLLAGTNIFVNDQASNNGEALTALGDYHVVVSDATGVTATDVGCYTTGDAHQDGVIDSRDIVAAKKEIANATEGQKGISISRRYAADVNGDGLYDAADMILFRNNMVGVASVTPSLAYSYSLTSDPLEMPIGGFNGPYRVSDGDLVSDTIYKKIADCGIDFISFSNNKYPTNGNDTDSMTLIQEQLQLAEKYDLGLFIQDAHIQESSEVWTKESLANRLSYYNNYRSFLGLAISDEPTIAGVYGDAEQGAEYERLESAASLANSFDNISAYVNMLPYNKNMVLDTTITDEQAYRNYLNTYCNDYNPKFLSYDNYPFEWLTDAITASSTSAKGDYYYFKNLAIVREIANEHQIPFWTHVQTGDSFDTNAGYSNCHNPSEGEFKWQINVELAFGAKGIQYFPLIQPNGFEITMDGAADYTRNGLIGKNGTETEWYAYAKQMNQQIKAMDHILMNSVSEGIMATGTYATANMNAANESSQILLNQFDLGNGNPIISGLNSVNTSYGAIAGCFDYQGKAAVYVVNYYVNGSNTITLDWDKSCTYKVLDRTGEVVYSNPATSHQFTLGAGEAALLVLE